MCAIKTAWRARQLGMINVGRTSARRLRYDAPNLARDTKRDTLRLLNIDNPRRFTLLVRSDHRRPVRLDQLRPARNTPPCHRPLHCDGSNMFRLTGVLFEAASKCAVVAAGGHRSPQLGEYLSARVWGLSKNLPRASLTMRGLGSESESSAFDRRRHHQRN
jgi:hypothetical protein